MKQYVTDSVTGVANSIVLGAGIAGIAAQQRHVDAIHCYVTGQIGNRVQAYLGTTLVFDVWDYMVLTDEACGSTSLQKTLVREIRFPVDIDLPVGAVLKVAMQCGATLKSLKAVYELTVN